MFRWYRNEKPGLRVIIGCYIPPIAKLKYLVRKNTNNDSPNSLVDSFWNLTSADAPCDINILPDDCIDVVYDLKNDKVFVCGLMTRSSLAKLDQNSNLLGVRVKIENFALLTTVPLEEIKNLKVDGSDIGITLEEDLSETFHQCDSMERKLSIFGNGIVKLRKNTNRNSDSLVNLIIKQIKGSKGKIDLNSLKEENCISIRQMQRRFKQQVGLTIKEFVNVIRFNNAVKNINQTNTGSLLNIAYESGFYDHSHMTNEFKRISSLNPSFFRKCRFSTKRIII